VQRTRRRGVIAAAGVPLATRQRHIEEAVRVNIRHVLGSLLIPLLLVVAAGANAATPSGPKASRGGPVVVDPLLMKELSWRSVGPANMGGRVSDFAIPATKPTTMYVALGTGGVFKTENQGTTWSPVFEKEAVASVGAIEVWPKNPDVVWAGTGEANSRNSSSWGNGVYRSSDGGGTWRHLGLDNTHTIGRIVADPNDSNTVYVAALGHLWGSNPERGVYKTSDGGRTWSLVLKVDAQTGCVDLAMDPRSPQTLYAAMYARRRTPWSYTSGGTTGGIFRTRDGGHSWTKLTDGLPKRTGRIGLEVYAADPRVVFAVVESDEGGTLDAFDDKSRVGGVFVSEDGGDHWIRKSPFAPRPFYFSQIRVQPDDRSRVYLLGTDLWISDDGGVSFRAGGAKNLHPDCHAMWISPSDGNHVVLGTDGGVFLSRDRAKNWDFINNLAVGEFYNVAVDMADPYRICGGLQDNQSWCGPSRTRAEADPWQDENRHLGIFNDQWICLGGGDGFHVAMDPTDSSIVYYESQGAYLNRLHLGSGRQRNLRPQAREGQPVFRFNWNSPFQISPHDPTVLWLGGNQVFKLYERGNKWEAVSPDLTTKNPDRMVTGGSSAETYCTIVSLAESPMKGGVIWAGTDDGKVWVTEDAGAHWSDVTKNLRGVPEGLYVGGVEPSHHAPGTAYVSMDGHRSDRFEPYLFVTRDFGKSWTSIVSDLPKHVTVKVVREDPQNPQLLFAGTEFGIYTSLDGGRHWQKLGDGLPTVAVDDIVIHPRERDIVIGTHGRSVWILDDATPLEQWTPAVADSPVTFFTPRATTAYFTSNMGGTWGQRMFAAPNPPFGAYFNYFIAKATGDGVTISVSDAGGREVRRLTGPGTPGFHRVVWDLQGEPRQRIPRPEWNDQPLFVPAARYTAKLTYGSRPSITRTVDVRVAAGAEPTND
jgi:photosystem II stability/assembly factor-like uncharacterized protein